MQYAQYEQIITELASFLQGPGIAYAEAINMEALHE
jgi:hypothetical protein